MVFFAARRRLLERDGKRYGHVAPRAAARPVARAGAAGRAPAEDGREDVIDAHAAEDVGKIDVPRAAGHAIHRAVPIVHGALLLVGQDGIRLVQLGELLVGVWSVVMVGMELDRLLSKSALDLIGRCVALDAQHLVVIPLVRHLVDPPPLNVSAWGGVFRPCPRSTPRPLWFVDAASGARCQDPACTWTGAVRST